MVGSNSCFQHKVVVGRLASAHGVNGWIKVWSYTEVKENILTYKPWWVESKGIFKELLLDDWKLQSNGLIVRLKGVADRDKAKDWCKKDILVDFAIFPKLPGDSFYWYQLIGLNVISDYQGGAVNLGHVSNVMATGANDVLIVSGGEESIDKKERLIPYIGEYVLSVDLQKQVIEVNWDPDF